MVFHFSSSTGQKYVDHSTKFGAPEPAPLAMMFDSRYPAQASRCQATMPSELWVSWRRNLVLEQGRARASRCQSTMPHDMWVSWHRNPVLKQGRAQASRCQATMPRDLWVSWHRSPIRSNSGWHAMSGSSFFYVGFQPGLTSHGKPEVHIRQTSN